MARLNKTRKKCVRAALVLCNLVLMTAAVLFTIWYSYEVKIVQERLMLESFCNTVDAMKQISVRYLLGERTDAANWASYIEQEHMTMEEALDYIYLISASSDCEAHVVDMDTFAAWSTQDNNGNNTINIYKRYLYSTETNERAYVARMRRMFAGEKCVLGKYKVDEAGRSVISVGLPVALRQPDGSDRTYLLLHVVPVERMKEVCLFPINYPTAELGLIALNGDYVIPSDGMRSKTFVDFVRYYSVFHDYPRVDAQLARLRTQKQGLMTMNNTGNQPCYWYYSRLDEFEDLALLGYIPVSDLHSDANDISIVIVVAFILLLLAWIDGAYILNMNSQLRVTAEIAKKANEAKSQFLSTMSHDIRTPLNAVLGMTELAKKHMDDNGYVQECLHQISLSGNHLLTLVNDILELSRIESGKIRVTPAPFAVRELVSALENITRLQAAERDQRFDVLAEDLPKPYLMGDKLRLTQICLNLLNNAVKYTDQGGSIRWDVWEEETENGGVDLISRIADTGVGMSPEFQKTMYDSFARVLDSRTDKIQGSGLGLAIVRRMVTLLNGSIACESEKGRGTTFTVRIPLTAVSEEAFEQKEKQENGRKTNCDLKGIRILIAEDNDVNWEIISELLSGYGAECERAENGQICVTRLLTAQPDTFDLVLMDIQMPVLNGHEAARKLRSCEREDLKKIPIVAMTADAFAEDIQLCTDAGMDAHIAKPVEIDKVLITLRHLQIGKNK